MNILHLTALAEVCYFVSEHLYFQLSRDRIMRWYHKNNGYEPDAVDRSLAAHRVLSSTASVLFLSPPHNVTHPETTNSNTCCYCSTFITASPKRLQVFCIQCNRHLRKPHQKETCHMSSGISNHTTQTTLEYVTYAHFA